MKPLLIAAAVLLAQQARDPDKGFAREGEGDRRRELDAIEGKPAPEIEVDRWLKGAPASLKALRGRVVLIQFWNVGSGPSRGAARQIKELHERFKEKDLTILAIHASSDAHRALEFVRGQQIACPVAVDSRDVTFARYKVDSCPDYYLVDRKGVLRFADLLNREVERAVAHLLAEK